VRIYPEARIETPVPHLRRSVFFNPFPALAPSARKRASGRAGLTCRRAYGAWTMGTIAGCRLDHGYYRRVALGPWVLLQGKDRIKNLPRAVKRSALINSPVSAAVDNRNRRDTGAAFPSNPVFFFADSRQSAAHRPGNRTQSASRNTGWPSELRLDGSIP
jgi:hypothetical protein